MARRPEQRRQRTRRPSILILCEGSKTEPNYLGAVLREFRLTAVSIPRNHDTDPIGLVRAALKELQRDEELTAYVVIDRDEHPSFDDAVGLATQHPLFGTRLRIFRSYPSFELWLLYHFEYSRAPMGREEALARLEAAYPAYSKGDAQCMDEFMGRMDTATNNAKKAMADALATGELNSSTEVHDLIEELEQLAANQ